MRLSVKLAALMIVSVSVAAASPFISDYLRLNSPGDAVATALSSAGKVLAPQPADASVDTTTTQSLSLSSQLQLAAAAAPKPATPAPTTTAKPPTTTTAPSTAAKPATPAPAAANTTLSQADLALVVMLVRNTLIALHQANITGNYTVLRDLGAPGFRDANTATKLSEIFAPIRSRGVDLSTAVLIEPKLSNAKINENGMLNIAGSLSTQPVPVNFEMLYQGVSNAWQLFGISISADQGPQAANPPGNAATPAAAPAARPPVPAARP